MTNLGSNYFLVLLSKEILYFNQFSELLLIHGIIRNDDDDAVNRQKLGRLTEIQ